MDYYLGIDGGGTSCRAALADADGRIVGRGKSGIANIMTDPDRALASIEAAAKAAAADAGLDPATALSAPAVLGLAGVNIRACAERIAARLPFARFALETDSSIALHGALGKNDGAVAILGTGSVFLSRHGTQVTQVGGWGFTLGDQGSGARIGRLALEQCLLAHDQIIPSSDLSESLLSEFGGDPERIVAFADGAKPADFGRYAVTVFDHASHGDAIAREIMETEARYVAGSIDAIIWPGCDRLCLLGGLAPFYPPFLAERHQGILIDPFGTALDGAVALAVERFARGAAA